MIASLVAAAAFTVTVGDVPMLVRVPPFCFVCVVNGFAPAMLGAVTELNVTLNWALAGQVMLMGMVEPVMVPRVAAVQFGAGPTATATLLVVGVVQPLARGLLLESRG